MKKFFALIVPALIACSPAQAGCSTGDPFPYTASTETGPCPGDIQSWMDRANACAHFAGEDPYDAERKQYIDNVMAENQCDAIGCDFKTLFRKYEGDIAYAGTLTGYAELTHGSVEGLPQCKETNQGADDER